MHLAPRFEHNLPRAQEQKIVTISCRFCHAVRSKKEDKWAKHQKPISTMKRWNSPFWTDHMKKMIDKHAEQWKEFQSVSDVVKRTYFDVSTQYAKPQQAHFETVDDLVCKVFHSQLLTLFFTFYRRHRKSAKRWGQQRIWKWSFFLNSKTKQWNLRIERRKCFNNVLGQVQIWISFRTVVLRLRSLRSSATLLLLEPIIEADVSMYVQLLHVVSLQHIPKVSGHTDCWAF